MLGFLTFIAYSSAVAGQTPLDTQQAWGGKDFHLPTEVIAASWQWAFDHHDPIQIVNIVTLVLFSVSLVAVFLRLPFSYFLFALPQVVLLATRLQPTPLTSTARYLLVVFPAFIVLAMISWQRVRIAWAIISTMFLAVLVVEFQLGTYVA